MITINEQRFSVLLPDATTVTPISGSIILDELWAPYIQATVEIALPVSLTVFDPRTFPPPRVKVTVQQDYTDSDEVSVFTSTFGAGTIAALTTLYAAATVATISAAHNRPWMAGEERRRVLRTFDLGIRGRVRTEADTLVLTLASDEAILQDRAPLTGAGISSGGAFVSAGVIDATTFQGLISGVLTPVLSPYIPLIDNTLDLDISGFIEDFSGVFGAPPLGFPWPAGLTAWDLLAPIIDMAGARLWCDEARAWHVTTVPTDNTDDAVTIAIGANLTGFSETMSRDTDWYDAVVIAYTWTSPTGTTLSDWDAAPYVGLGGSPKSRPYSTTRDLGKRKSGFTPPFGAAEALRKQTVARGREVQITAVNDFSLNPGTPVNLTVPGGSLTGRVGSVTWDFETREMSLTTRNIT